MLVYGIIIDWLFLQQLRCKTKEILPRSSNPKAQWGKGSIQRGDVQFLILGESLGVPLTGVLWGEERQEGESEEPSRWVLMRLQSPKGSFRTKYLIIAIVILN